MSADADGLYFLPQSSLTLGQLPLGGSLAGGRLPYREGERKTTSSVELVVLISIFFCEGFAQGLTRLMNFRRMVNERFFGAFEQVFGEVLCAFAHFAAFLLGL